ncbi:MAG: MlaD family protein [Salinisphaera sp.]|jgi:paraquat-inducible protein B|nr:MlaD family protein [Salinisphaera sp.]
MSESDDSNASSAAPGNGAVPETGPPKARMRRTPWRGWIWSVPLAAMILVAYLAARTWLLTGPTITITFPEAAGISASGTSLRYKGVQVGNVESVALTDDRHAVKVTVSVDSSVAKFLRTGTVFWVNQPSILSGQLGNLLSGPYITMRPGPGKQTRSFKGRLKPPTTAGDKPGRLLTLHAATTGGLHQGSLVLYRGLDAGKVMATGYDKQHDGISITVFVNAPFNRHLGKNVRFWRSSGLGLSTGSGGVSFRMPPISQLLNGAVTFGSVKPALRSSQASSPDTLLYASASAAHHALAGPHVTFSARFPGSTAGISAGSPVELKGIRVGTVRSVSLAYDPKQKRMITPVTFDLYPDRFGIAHPSSANTSTRSFKHVLATLIHQGLRAQLTTGNLVLGNKQLSLVMAGSPGQASLDTASQPPRIPAIGVSDIGTVMTSVSQLTQNLNDKIRGLPVQAIGHHLLKLTARAQALADSPELTQSIHHLNRTLAHMQTITGEAQGQVKPTLKSLRQVADAADGTAKTITRLAGGSLAGNNSMQQLVAELTRTARAVRVLADYLQRHPESLIRGRHGR